MTHETQENPRYIGPGEVCTILGISPDCLLRWRKATPPFGPPCKMFGRSARFERSAVLQWIEDQPTHPEAAERRAQS